MRSFLMIACAVLAGCATLGSAADRGGELADGSRPGSHGAECLADGSCSGALVCVQGFCVAPTGPGRLGGACVEGACESPLTCVDERCEPPPGLAAN